jgi:transposase
MVHFVGLDVSVKATSVCVVDDAGKVILEQKVSTDPADIIAILTSLGVSFGRIGIEAGPLSQWLVNALTAANLPVICVETRHMKALLTAQQISKTDRNDARGIPLRTPGGRLQRGRCSRTRCRRHLPEHRGATGAAAPAPRLRHRVRLASPRSRPRLRGRE